MREFDPAQLEQDLNPEQYTDVSVNGNKPKGSFKTALRRHRTKLGSVAARKLTREPNGDRSQVLYGLGAKIVESGIPYDDAWWLLYGSTWGQSKYGDRPQEIHRILQKLSENTHAPTKLRPSKRGAWEDLYSLLGKELPSPKWLVENIWGEGNFGVMAGQAKSHKTWLSLDLAVSISSGKPFLDKYKVNDPGPVMVVEAEVRKHSMRHRSMLIANSKGLAPTVSDGGISVPNVWPLLLRRETGIDLTDEEQFDRLAKKVKKVKPRLLILDPIQFMLGDGDENAARDMRRVLVPLSELALETGTGVCVVHHFKKNYEPTTRGGQRASGSQVFHAWGESNLWIDYVADNAIRVQREFRDFDSPGDIEVVFDIDDEDYEPWVEEFDPMKKEHSRKKPPGGSSVVDYVEANPGITAKQLAEKLGKAEKTARKFVISHPYLEFRPIPSRKKGGRKRHGVFVKDEED